jgi:hypothetical protein
MLLDCCEELGFSRLKQKIKTMLNFADHGTSTGTSTGTSESHPIALDLSSLRMPKWLTGRKNKNKPRFQFSLYAFRFSLFEDNLFPSNANKNNTFSLIYESELGR